MLRQLTRLSAGYLTFCLSLSLSLALPAEAQEIQTENVSGSDVVASEALVRLQPGVSLVQVAQMVDASAIRAIGKSGLVLLRSRSLNALAVIGTLRLSGLVSWAEPNYVIQSGDTVPNDPNFQFIWGLRNTGQSVNGQGGIAFADIGAAKAWDITVGSPSVAVAVVDTGVDYTHGDLAANVWSAPAPYQLTLGGVTYTCPAGSHGFNAMALTCDPLDDNTHGTHVSGSIGALGNNLLGVTGVNWKTSIVGFKFLNAFGRGSAADAVNAIEAAIQLKALGVNIRAMNASWGFQTQSTALMQAISDAGAADILFVAAAGNNGQSNDPGSGTGNYPAAYGLPNIIAVAATDNQDKLATFSNYGINSVHVGAPGVDIESLYLNNNYGFLSGTSMATAYVTGAAALLLSKCTLDTAALKSALMNSVDLIPSLTNKTISGGRINVYRGLVNCGAIPVPDFTIAAAPASVSVLAGNQATTSINVSPLFDFSGTISFSATGLPPGVTASFSPGSLSSSGNSTLTFTTLPTTVPGVYPINVHAISGNLTNLVTVNLTVAGPDFALGGPATLSIPSGSSGSARITLDSLNGFSSTVNLTASGLPPGVTATFAPASLPGSGVSTLTLNTAPTTSWSSFTITIQGASGTLIHTLSLSVTVFAPPDFALAATPASVSIPIGGPAVSTINVSAIFSFSGAVNLSASGLPQGVTASFSPPAVNGSGTSTLTLTALPSAVAGSSTLTITGISGTLQHSILMAASVLALPSIVITPSLTITPGSDAPLPVSLTAPAPAGGIDITLSSTNPGVATPNQTSIFIPQGQTSNTRPRISGLSEGLATITASGVGFTTGTSLVQVGSGTGTMSFNPPSVTLSAPVSQNLTLTLSKPAPVGGLTVLLNSSIPAVATVPASIVIPANTSSGPVVVTAAGAGLTTITATAVGGYSAATATVTVPSALAITTVSLYNGQVGSPYSQTLAASGGTKPYTWTLNSGLPPANLTLSSAGVLSGTPNVTATNLQLGFKVTDSSLPQQTATIVLPLTVTATPAPASITAVAGTPQSAPTGGTFAVPLAALVKDSNGNVLSNVSVLFTTPASGPGATFPGNATSATATTNAAGIATAPALTASATAGTYAVNAAVTGVAPAPFALTNVAGPSIILVPTLALAPGADAGLAITLSAAAPQGGLDIALASSNPSVAGLNLTSVYVPQGLTMITRARVSGLSAGQATITASAAGYSNGITQVQVGTVATNLTITTPALPSGQVGTFYSQTLQADGGSKPYSWSITSGALPDGLTLNSSTGAISGTPTAVIANTLAGFKVTDTSSPVKQATATLGVTINAAATASAIVAVAGTPQSAGLGSAFGSLLVAFVKDANGNPVSNVTVTFTAPPVGASGLFNGATTVATAVTSGSGLATAPSFLANSTGGGYIVTAGVSGIAALATFSLTNVSGPTILTASQMTLAPGADALLQLSLSAPAPAGGLSLALTSSNPAVATTNLAFAFIPQGQTSTTRARLTGIAAGSAVVSVSAPGFASASIQVQVSQ